MTTWTFHQYEARVWNKPALKENFADITSLMDQMRIQSRSIAMVTDITNGMKFSVVINHAARASLLRLWSLARGMRPTYEDIDILDTVICEMREEVEDCLNERCSGPYEGHFCVEHVRPGADAIKEWLNVSALRVGHGIEQLDVLARKLEENGITVTVDSELADYQPIELTARAIGSAEDMQDLCSALGINMASYVESN